MRIERSPATQTIQDYFPGPRPGPNDDAFGGSVRRYGLLLEFSSLYLPHDQKSVAPVESNFIHFNDRSAGQDAQGHGVIGIIVFVRFIVLNVAIWIFD